MTQHIVDEDKIDNRLLPGTCWSLGRFAETWFCSNMEERTVPRSFPPLLGRRFFLLFVVTELLVQIFFFFSGLRLVNTF